MGGGPFAAGPFGAGPFGGGPRQLSIQKVDENDEDTPRFEESHGDIMLRMNKLSQEIGEKHDQQKLLKLSSNK